MTTEGTIALDGTALPDDASRNPVDGERPHDLTKATVRGAVWSLLGSVANGFLQFAVMVVMARLVAPQDFGLMAMAQVFLRFATYFAAFGIGTALVRQANMDGEKLRAAFTGAWILGSVCAGVMWVVAPLALLIFNTSGIVPVVRALAVNFALAGFGVVSAGLLYRRMRFRTLSIVGMGAYVVAYGVVGIPLALHGWGVWALVAAIMTQTVLAAACQYLCAVHPIRPTFRWASYRDLLGFGGQHSVAGFLEFLGNAADSFALGRYLGERAFGLYSRASLLISLPVELVVAPVIRVFYPLFVHARSDPEKLRRVYCATFAAVALITIPSGMATVLVARDLVAVTLGMRWTPGTPALLCYALIMPATFLTAVTFSAHDAIGRMRSKIAVQAVSLTVFSGAVVLGLPAGIQGVACGALAGYLFRMLIEHAVLRKRIGVSWRQLGGALAPAFWSAAVLTAAAWPVVLILVRAPAWARVACVVFLAPLAVVITAFCIRPPAIVRLAGLVREVWPQTCAWRPCGWVLARLSPGGPVG